ncbi:GNAT family N-acetyltransferase [Streptomyces sp. JJ66]|uniref:GNAT family N-acetyltransferase n=1 Tax=Streptomyces sp. JJ66 TaxID=2803843 RepID=UPI001C58E97A|nr:GNAT family N-acetyltransferase [Streptomyces sp. JJ66]MBW1603069.1 GNAT family N-acetyltransferase [Streptomyces sp. JJ66]
MRIHWGQITPLMTVPYIPTLGPVHPDAVTADLFEDVARIAGTGDFLPHDKDRRWPGPKNEHLLGEDVVHHERLALLPTLTRRGDRTTVKVHVYGSEPDSLTTAADLAHKLAANHNATAARLVWFLDPGQPETYALGTGTRLQLKTFQKGPQTPAHADVTPYDELPPSARHSFAPFAEAMKNEGFDFLHQQVQTGDLGPVLTITRNGRVAGAIGPMETITDAAGRTQLLPQYFGVQPEHRGHGYGRALWRAAMNWGHHHGADYQLLQTEVGGASDRLCQTEDLASLGFICTRTL